MPVFGWRAYRSADEVELYRRLANRSFKIKLVKLRGDPLEMLLEGAEVFYVEASALSGASYLLVLRVRAELRADGSGPPRWIDGEPIPQFIRVECGEEGIEYSFLVFD